MASYHATHVLYILLAVLAVGAQSGIISDGLQSHCQKVVFTVTVSSENLVFANPPDLNSEASIIEFASNILEVVSTPPAGTVSVSGTFTINGVYCKPILQDRHALQILVHGATYTKEIWSGYGYSPKYDWHLYANLQGYHTLAIDRVGHGENPQHPNPLDAVQGYLGTEVSHQIIQAIRNGAPGDNPLLRTFNNIVWVGHSYGSETGVSLAGRYPEDIDILILTGYSSSLNVAVGSVEFQSGQTRTGDSRFDNVPLGYLVFANLTQRREFFYAGSYDPQVLAIDNANDDTVTIGEFATITFGLAPAVGFTNPILVATADHDAIFCDVASSQYDSCAAILDATQALFPNTTRYETHIAKDAGHLLTLHGSAPETLASVHEFLDQYL